MAVTNWSSVNNLSGIMQVANDNAGGYFWTGMLFMIFIILFVSLIAFGIEAALLGAAFSCLMIGIIMVYMGIMAWSWLLCYVGVILVGFLWIIYNQRE